MKGIIAIAVVVLLGISIVGLHDASLTGQNAKLLRLHPETIKKVAESQSDTRPLYTIPKETLKKVVPQPTTAYSVECPCENPYEGYILTPEEAEFTPGLSIIDCMLLHEIDRINEQLKSPQQGSDITKNIVKGVCEAKGWWPKH